MNMQSQSERIPVTLLTGFLGSGKTTALNHLVQQAELADALVIINEFGDMPLDHQLVTHSTENVTMEMSSGCLCCSIRGDLVQALRDVHWRFARDGQRRFRRLLIETTGLADPAPIIHTLITNADVASRYRLDGVVTALDLATGSETLDQHTEAVKQAALADVLLLTKADLVTDQQYDALRHRLDDINPAAPRWPVRQGVVSPGKVLDLGLFSAEGKTADVERWLQAEAYAEDHHGHAHAHDVNRHDDHIRAFCFTLSAPIADALFSTLLELLMQLAGSEILRIKGILNIEEWDAPVVIHGVQHIFHPPLHLPAWPSDDHRSRLVFITRDVGAEAIKPILNAFVDAQPAHYDGTDYAL